MRRQLRRVHRPRRQHTEVSCGPLSETSLVSRRTWSAYRCNGHIHPHDMAQGFDVLRLVDRRTDSAKNVTVDELNARTQPHYR